MLITSLLKLTDRYLKSAGVKSRGKNQAFTFWLTGLSGAGKSTLALTLQRKLAAQGKVCHVLDGDHLRQGLNSDLGFSPVDRRENIRRVAEVARLMNDAGLIVITALISPYRDDRALARQIIGGQKFLEIYLNTPLAVCEHRDPKGLYQRARAGQIQAFTGITSPYESPESADLVLDTSQIELSDCVSRLMGIFP